MTPDRAAQLTRLLGNVTVFADLTPRELGQVLSVAAPRRMKAGEVVMRKGDAGSRLFVIVAGSLKVATGAEGRDATLAVMGRGEVFGEVALLDGEPRSATVSALEAGELLVLERAAFLELLRRSPGIAIKLLAVMARRLRRLSERLEDTVFLEAPARLAKRLLELADRYGERLPDGRSRLRLRLTQQELAELVGATRETVNKSLRSWAAHRWVNSEGGHLVLGDAEALRRVAAGGP